MSPPKHLSKVAFFPGCDTGFGFETAKSMHALGLKVFAGCLNKQGQGGQELAAMGIDVLQLDVTKEDQWDEAVKHIKLHSTGLWGLVNNAGWSTFGDVEWVPMDIYRKIADINIFGLLLALKKITPLIRSSKGRIVTVTSGLTRGPAPNRSAYVLTKYAGVGLMECLRYEMARFGVKVSMIEPGNYLAATRLFDKSIIGKQADFMWQQMSDEVKSAYGEVEFRKKIALMDTYFQVGCKTVQPVVESYTNALLDVFPQVRYVPMDLGWRTRAFVYTHCPEGVFEWLYI